MFMRLEQDKHRTGNQAFIDTRNSSGSAFLSHQFSARQSIGMQYQLLNMVFQGDSHTVTQGFFLFDRIVLSPHVSFTIFAGPQYSHIHNQEAINSQSIVVLIPESKTLWSPAAGGMMSWERERTAFYGEVTRRVSAGLGLLSSVELNEATFDVRRRVTSRWIANVSGQMSEDTLLSAASRGHIRMWNIGAGISRELGRDMHVGLAYERIRRSGDYLSAAGFGNHNRVLLTFERSFAWPMGR
jgi:hypothetical protein